ncbi:MAG TPA: alpha/beta hydrolase [Thermoleophilaceae bacterium]|jgi:pimeloyl-ACP methyl ester carboxylesterase
MRTPSLFSQPPIWRESRFGLEMAALLRDPVYQGEGVSDGRGQPVLLVPGFLAGDDSLGVMTRWLRRTGHHTRKAGMRSNINCSETAVGRLEERVEVLAESRGQKVAIVGQSRGGNFARVLAVRRPDLISGIIALGSPQVDPMAVHPLIRLPVIAVGALGTLGAPGLFSHSCRSGRCCEQFWEDMHADFPNGVGYVSIYSRSDGIVDWRSCLDPAAEHVEIKASHCGMAVSPHAYRETADALSRFRRRARRQTQSLRLRRAA